MGVEMSELGYSNQSAPLDWFSAGPEAQIGHLKAVIDLVRMPNGSDCQKPPI